MSLIFLYWEFLYNNPIMNKYSTSLLGYWGKKRNWFGFAFFRHFNSSSSLKVVSFEVILLMLILSVLPTCIVGCFLFLFVINSFLLTLTSFKLYEYIIMYMYLVFVVKVGDFSRMLYQKVICNHKLEILGLFVLFANLHAHRHTL